MTTPTEICDLPDDLRAPLHSLRADIPHLFGRVAEDGSLASIMMDSAATRLSHIEEAAYRLNARALAAEAALEKMREAANNLLTRMFSTYKARNGREVGIEADDGEACWIVHSDDIETLRSALSPTTQGGGE